MSNANNKYIAVSYRLYIDGDNGKELVEEAKADKPFHFISGFGIALDAFEQQVGALAKGEHFAFSLPKEQAYGDFDEQHVIELAREVFNVDGQFDKEHIYVDAIIPLQNADGNRFYGRVVEVGNEKVKVDLNHPLAGEALHFEGDIIENRPATDDELKSMIAHLSGGCHCGGGCHGGHGDEGCHCDGEHGEGHQCCGHCHEN